MIRFDDRTDNEKAYYVELWNKVPNNTELPNKVYQYAALTGDNPQEIVLTLSVRGIMRVIAEHNGGFQDMLLQSGFFKDICKF